MQHLQLSIPEPCHENWDNMSPTQKGRFCNSCAKEVVDFSSMTDTQVLNYFNVNVSEKVCGRAYPDQLERAIEMPAKPKGKLFRYWNYAAALFLFFAKSNTVKAQGMVAYKVEKKAPQKSVNTTCTKPIVINPNTKIRMGAIATPISKEPLIVIDSVIHNENDLKDLDPNKIEKINILKGQEAEAIYGMKAVNGVIEITTKKTDLIIVIYKQLDSVVVRANNSTHLQGAMSYAVAGGMSIRRTEKINKLDTLKAFVNTVISPIKIYPNPTQRGETFTVSFPAKANNNYTIQILNSSGKIISQQQVNAVGKNLTQQIHADSRWAAGMYFIRIFDHQNKLINKSSFIVH